MKNNLKKIKEMYNLTNDQLLDILGVESPQTVKNYLSGGQLPIQKAILLSEYAENKKKEEDENYEIDEKNFLSLDWIYCRNKMLETDSMVNVIYALRKVIAIEVEIDNSGNKHPILAIDKRFRNFLNDYKNHEFYARCSDVVDLEMYNMGRKKLFDKHKEFLKDLLDEESFGSVGFNTADGIKLFQGFTEQDTIENYLIIHG